MAKRKKAKRRAPKRRKPAVREDPFEVEEEDEPAAREDPFASAAADGEPGEEPEAPGRDEGQDEDQGRDEEQAVAPPKASRGRGGQASPATDAADPDAPISSAGAVIVVGVIFGLIAVAIVVQRLVE